MTLRIAAQTTLTSETHSNAVLSLLLLYHCPELNIGNCLEYSVIIYESGLRKQQSNIVNTINTNRLVVKKIKIDYWGKNISRELRNEMKLINIVSIIPILFQQKLSTCSASEMKEDIWEVSPSQCKETQLQYEFPLFAQKIHINCCFKLML